MIILQPQLTLTTAASAPNTPLATRREEVTRDPPDARERATYTIYLASTSCLTPPHTDL